MRRRTSRLLRGARGGATAPRAQTDAPSASRPRRTVDSREALHDFWRNPDRPNVPEEYLAPTERSRFLLDLIGPHLTPSSRVLEIGCNVGRNLAHLHEAGYRDLTGIEINGDAVALLRSSYPELAATATLIVSPVEDAIKAFDDDSFDLIYTMAVLEHIHPDSEWIFAEMVRVARSFVVTIEDEQGVSHHHTPRDYGQVFGSLGARQIHALPVDRIFEPAVGFVARVFETPAPGPEAGSVRA
jgi:SAM-dependent methyltransferase